MGKEGTGDDVLQILGKRRKLQSKNRGKIKDRDYRISEFQDNGRNEVIEHVKISDVENIAEIKRHHRDGKKKKDRGTKDAEEVDKKKEDASKEKVIGDDGTDGNGNAMDKADKKKKRKENKKNRDDASDMSRIEVGSAEEVVVNKGQQRPLQESIPELKSGKEAKKDRKKHKATRNQKDGDTEKEGEKEDGKECGTFSENIEATVLEKVKTKKRKRERKNSKNDDCIRLQGNYKAATMESIIIDSFDRTLDNENKSEELFETITEDHKGNFAEKIKRKKKKMTGNKQVEGDFSAMQQENVPKNVKGNAQSTIHDGGVTKKRETKKHKTIKDFKDDSPAAQLGISMQDFVDTVDTDKTHGEELNAYKGKKKKTKSVDSGLNDPTPSKSNKKVRFSGQVEVFPLHDSGEEEGNDKEETVVQGKRFTPKENEIVKEAVYKYIEEHDLGENGLNMVLNCSKYPQLRGCWREIGTAIPYRPYTAVYFRAQVIFRRSENRKWTQEEYEMVRKYQEVHGNEWKALADELGKHRWHVKDTWRRIKLPNAKKGHWSQKEYQNLFDLVNNDLQLKVSEEKKSKHGMLRDDISWTAISDKLATRYQANCCVKWYKQLTSSMVAEGLWADTDDYRMIGKLYRLDASCMEDVDWDNLIDDRSGDICRKRWNQMVLHIGHHGNKPFAEQVDTLAQRYCPNLLEAREIWDNKPVVP